MVLTGAGISAESGLRTFRDSDGLWEGYDIYEVASPRGWKKDPKLVLDFYNMRRKDVAAAQPNAAHLGLYFVGVLLLGAAAAAKGDYGLMLRAAIGGASLALLYSVLASWRLIYSEPPWSC